METHVNSPQVIFIHPQRLLVPLFQRPYVWDEDRQWRPLWHDVSRLAEKVLRQDHSAKHFLGAVVLQQENTPIGTLTVRTVIDGQQRLTTLQLLFDAILEEIRKLGFEDSARRLVDLVENGQHQRHSDEDQFKVWPTNRDREAFAEVMGTPMPQYSKLANKGSKIVKAHEYFAGQAAEWLGTEPEQARLRVDALVEAVAMRLQIVTIDLRPDEDAQEIFETLNARGTPLTAADLIKNLVFQRLGASPEDSEKAYNQYWRHFETEFWEAEVSSGRVLYSRSSLFLTQWLTSQTRQEIPAREVFAAFKRYLDDQVSDVVNLLEHIRACADLYQALLEGAAKTHVPLSELEMFVYRLGEMQSEISRPILIWLTDPRLEPVPAPEMRKAIRSLESWLVRRTLVREKSQGQNTFLLSLLGHLAQGQRSEAGTRLEEHLRDQTSDTSYWPDDAAVRSSLDDMAIYRRISRGRLRMVLEAIEDHKRGYTPGHQGAKSEQPVVRSACTIEHVMPQSWGQHWPLPQDETAPERDRRVQTLGNLTLVSKSLNPSMSNAAWLGAKGKKVALQDRALTKLTDKVIQVADEHGGQWTDELIEERTASLIEDILHIWSVPNGHTNEGRSGGDSSASGYEVRDLLKAGLLVPGQQLFGGAPKHFHARATVLADGQLEVDGHLFDSPSGAGRAATGRSTNGWAFWRIERNEGTKLRQLRDQLGTIEPELNFGPYAALDLVNWWTKDVEEFGELALTVTDCLPKLDTVFPAQRGKGDFVVARYWAHDHGQPNIAVGVPKVAPAVSPATPIWARYSTHTSGFDEARTNLMGDDRYIVVEAENGDLWIPLTLPEGEQDTSLVEALAQEVLEIDRIARGADR
jgi:hypothetical protein